MPAHRLTCSISSPKVDAGEWYNRRASVGGRAVAVQIRIFLTRSARQRVHQEVVRPWAKARGLSLEKVGRIELGERRGRLSVVSYRPREAS